ncbi:uncharacterized protein [Apostichopus japonicus]
MTLKNIFKRKKKYKWLSEESLAHSDIDVQRNIKDGSEMEEETKEFCSERPSEGQKRKKNKSFLRSVKNIIFLKKFRSSKDKKQKDEDVYEKLREDFGEIDDAKFEIISPNDKKEEKMENLEDVMCNGKKLKVDKSSKDRIKMKREANKQQKKRKQGVRIDPKATQFKKRKTAKKKAIKATKRTGKFIGRGALYTSSAFQYIAPVASLPTERNWKRWEERSSREAYRQSQYIFL